MTWRRITKSTLAERLTPRRCRRPSLQQPGDEAGCLRWSARRRTRGARRRPRRWSAHGVTAVAQVDRPAAPDGADGDAAGRAWPTGCRTRRCAATKSGVFGGSGLLKPIAGDRHGGDDVDDGRALRVAAEHQPGVGAGVHHELDVRAGVVGAVSRGEEVVAGRVVDGVGADRAAADLAAQLSRRTCRRPVRGRALRWCRGRRRPRCRGSRRLTRCRGRRSAIGRYDGREDGRGGRQTAAAVAMRRGARSMNVTPNGNRKCG